MPQIMMSADVFDVARRSAVKAGYDNVEQYLSDMVLEDSSVDFAFEVTPPVQQKLDEAEADVLAGRVFDRDEVEARLAQHRKDWIEKNGR